MFEAYGILGYIAARTSRVKLGVLASGVTYRNPGFLVKQVTGLDVLSGGRAWLGIGAAWYEREHLGLGWAFPPLRERYERLEEAIRICLQMWSDDDGPFEGAHYQLAETLCSPRPVQQPRPPIMVAGSGERKTLRLVARYGDQCNVRGDSAEGAKRLFEISNSTARTRARTTRRSSGPSPCASTRAPGASAPLKSSSGSGNSPMRARRPSSAPCRTPAIRGSWRRWAAS